MGRRRRRWSRRALERRPNPRPPKPPHPRRPRSRLPEENANEDEDEDEEEEEGVDEDPFLSGHHFHQKRPAGFGALPALRRRGKNTINEEIMMMINCSPVRPSFFPAFVKASTSYVLKGGR